MSRFERHLFFCLNERGADDPKGSCMRCGAAALHEYAKMRAHELGLKGKVRVNKAGCLDACGHGPAMVVYPDAVWYSPKTKEDVEEILQSHIKNGQPVARLAIEFKKK